ncbi:YesL family protein [Metabacillus halosaccharovorans]|uniref:YesL family protein n=1 Tax=Metabacillus halosaccharovorans TaxID=930124 RepID=UPI00203D67DA|nr:YesL family protein [Metabacillus halosaccharovorans]MCM3443496.1 YesL family protein [Metabacillus halosaccharovorans]
MAQEWKGAFVRFTEWFSRVAYINLLWISFTLLGLVVFGFIPATVAMFAVMRKWQKGNLTEPVFQSFWGFYRKEFAKSNSSGLVLGIIGYILYADIFILNFDESLSMQIVKLLLYILALVYFMILAFFFPVYVHFDMKWYQYLKMVTLIVFAAPLQAVLMLLIGYGMVFLLIKMPILMLFLLGSLISYVWLLIALPTFTRLEQRPFSNEK